MKKFLLIAGTAVTLLTSACAPTITQQHPGEIAVQQTIPLAQWVTHETSSFSLSLPPSWRALDESVLESEAGEFDDEFASSFDFTFFAMDLANTATFETSLNVIEENLAFEMPFEDYVRLSARGIKYFNDVQGDVTHRVIDLPSGKVGYFNYISEIPVGYSSETVAMTQYLFKQGLHCYILSFANAVELQDVYGPVFEQIVKTVNLTPGTSPHSLPESQLSLVTPVPVYLTSFSR